MELQNPAILDGIRTPKPQQMAPFELFRSHFERIQRFGFFLLI